jgi:hypothetical protein
MKLTIYHWLPLLPLYAVLHGQEHLFCAILVVFMHVPVCEDIGNFSYS